jgi:hypothetical protein
VDLCKAAVKSDWADRLFDQVFPRRLVKQENVKTPLPHEWVQRLFTELSANIGHEDKILRMMAMRDLLMIYLGFFCLLRQSEIVRVRVMDLVFKEDSPGREADCLYVGQSKTDQAGVGIRIPLVRTIPWVGDVRPIVRALAREMATEGWPRET